MSSSNTALLLFQTAAQGVGAVSRPRAGRRAEAGRQQADAAQHLPGHRLGAVDPPGENYKMSVSAQYPGSQLCLICFEFQRTELDRDTNKLTLELLVFTVLFSLQLSLMSGSCDSGH